MPVSVLNENDTPLGVFVGVAAVDIIYRVDTVPLENSKIMADRRILAAGGPAANAAITFGFFGGRTKLVNAVGAHALASVIRDDLTLGSVELVDLASQDFVPIASAILVTKGGWRCFTGRFVIHLADRRNSLPASNSLHGSLPNPAGISARASG